MNLTIFATALRERLSNRIRIGFLAFLVMVEIVKNLGSSTLPEPSITTLYGLILGGTIVSGDVASGVLHLVWSRPVSRTSYCLAKWGALATATWLASLVGFGIALATGHGATLDVIGQAVLARLAAAVGIAAVLVLFSSLLPRLGDVALWVALELVVLNIGQWLSPDLYPATCYLASVVSTILWPASSFATADVVSGAVAYLSTVVGSLALASLVLARKELSYAD